MNTLTMAIGIAALFFGLYNLFMRARQPHKLGKLQAMKDLFGAETGDRIHVGAYVILPLAGGAVFLFAGFNGVSLFG